MAPPPSLKGRYQLVIIGSGNDAAVEDCARRLDNALALSFGHLGVDPNKFLVRVLPESGTEIDRRMPSVGTFFGLTAPPRVPTQALSRLETLLNDGALIIPIVGDLHGYSAHVPTQIAHLNGISIFDCGRNFERLAGRVLEAFGLLRERRRLFISYRRRESSGVAGQLYESLDIAGFDVFLDTHGALRPGEAFQEILWHRLADTDVGVLLDTPGFLESRWTEEELARANTSNLQILQILWPGRSEGATAAFSTFHPLTTRDFLGKRTLGPTALLREGSVRAIVDTVEGLRARAVGARHAFLVREFFLQARSAGVSLRTSLDRTMIVSTKRGGDIIVQPAVGVPDAERYEALEELHRREARMGRTYRTPSVLLYDSIGIRERWLKHLSWLDGNLASVRSVSLLEARRWLESLKAGRE